MSSPPLSSTSITSNSNNKKKRSASSDLKIETDATEPNTTVSDKKRSKGYARFAYEDIEKMNLEFRSEDNYQETLQCFAHILLALCNILEHGIVMVVFPDVYMLVLSSSFGMLELQDLALGHTRGVLSFK
ncbi:hypothetical protein ONS95_000538 [Cadophora gregata]|uniref:uncharacterized protein n=1 Tax=Cadophora gregata TaxID=51156 RepID=UPI0026DAC7D0|nr:uncharacterized protein ONS95_000538 [Cadophora gregata]KAK0128574.1 hypothetical protein ONS95_000538 [Cadophora gregata]